MTRLPDPRRFPPPGDGNALHARARDALAAATGLDHDRAAGAVRDRLREALASGEGDAIELALRDAPSVEVHRFLWRRLSEVLSEPIALSGGAFGLHLFALPVILVCASREAARVPAVVPRADALREALADGGFLGGNRGFGLAAALSRAESFAPDRLVQARRAATAAALGTPPGTGTAAPGTPLAVLDFPPAEIAVEAGSEAAHLRFLAGTAVAPAGARLFDDTEAGRWSAALTRHFARELATPSVQVLALARPPQPPLAALWAGRVAQREVALQLFVSNALRRLRAEVGEPVAVLSAHALDGGGGELRLSLSSALDERRAEGFRFPLHPLDRVEDAVATLLDLLRACRVADVRTLSRVHPDRDPHSGAPLLFKPGSIDPDEVVTRH